MPYIDGFVLAVPMANKSVYEQHAEAAAAVFRKNDLRALR
ncbi:MAG: DUF1428 family protein [Cyanobacteria bacterium J06638_6]